MDLQRNESVEEPDEVAAESLRSLGLPEDRVSIVWLSEYPDLQEYDVRGQCRYAVVLPDGLVGMEQPRLEVGAIISRLADARVYLF